MRYAIIVAGGTGTRMKGAALPKQFIEIAGKPVIVYTIEAFLTAVPGIKIIIPLPPDWQDHWHHIKEKFFPEIDIISATGGKTRYHSVKNSLQYTSKNSIVAVHDSVRPLINPDLIKTLFDTAGFSKTAIPMLPVTDTLRKIQGELTVTVDRSQFLIVQTPQCFHHEIITEAYEQDYKPDFFTDDASVVQAAGFSLSFVEGSKNNIKITTVEDLKLAEALINLSN